MPAADSAPDRAGQQPDAPAAPASRQPDANPGPVLRRRQAGSRLRQLREAAGKSVADVAAYLDCSAAKISRIETGRLSARIPDVRNMLEFYAVPESHRAAVLDLVRESREKGWWHAFPEIVADGFGTFIGFEDSAARIWQYESYLVPGLLQTREYAHAVQVPRMDGGAAAAGRYVEVRMIRQAVLTRPQPPETRFVVDESALHRLIALGPQVARPQFHHLVKLARLPNVTLQVLTYASGVGASTGLSFTVFGFPDPADPNVVHLDSLGGPSFESKADGVARYTAAFEGLRSIALPPAESVSFIATLLDRAG